MNLSGKLPNCGFDFARSEFSEVAEGGLVTAILAKVGAFSLPANSLDSAILVTFPLGPYKAQVSGANGSIGMALAEVYEVN